MPRVATNESLTDWMALQPELSAGLGALSAAVYGKSGLPLRVREIARMRIAIDNQCQVCLRTRDANGAAAGMDEEFYAHVPEWRSWSGYSARERLAAEYAERYAREPLALREDEDFWTRLHGQFSDAEIIDLGICCSLWLGSGRMMRVLDLGQTCSLVLNQEAPA